MGVRNEADKRCRNWLKDCGLTPADRNRVAELQPADDPSDARGDLLKQQEN